LYSAVNNSQFKGAVQSHCQCNFCSITISAFANSLLAKRRNDTWVHISKPKNIDVVEQYLQIFRDNTLYTSSAVIILKIFRCVGKNVKTEKPAWNDHPHYWY